MLDLYKIILVYITQMKIKKQSIKRSRHHIMRNPDIIIIHFNPMTSVSNFNIYLIDFLYNFLKPLEYSIYDSTIFDVLRYKIIATSLQYPLSNENVPSRILAKTNSWMVDKIMVIKLVFLHKIIT